MADDFTTDYFPDDWWPPGWFPPYIPPNLIDFKDFVVEARMVVSVGVVGMDTIAKTVRVKQEVVITVHADRSDREFAVRGNPTVDRNAAVIQDKAVTVEM